MFLSRPLEVPSNGPRQTNILAWLIVLSGRGDLRQDSLGAFPPYLATSLNNLSVQQSETGGRAEVLEPITEAVPIHRQRGHIQVHRGQLDTIVGTLASAASTMISRNQRPWGHELASSVSAKSGLIPGTAGHRARASPSPPRDSSPLSDVIVAPGKHGESVRDPAEPTRRCLSVSGR